MTANFPSGMVDQRRATILEEVMRAYVDCGGPVSSEYVADRLPFTVSSATVRNAMASLEADGYLAQPHVSAGRAPTEKAFRFIAAKLLEDREDFRKETSVPAQDVRQAARRFAHRVRTIAFVSIGGEVGYDGFEFVFGAPEFRDADMQSAFAKLMDELTLWEDRLRAVLNGSLRIFVGSENPLIRGNAFSVAAAQCDSGMLALLGPIRMDYWRAVAALRQFIDA